MEATGIEERGVGSGETAALLAERTGRPLSERRDGEGTDVGSAVSDSDHCGAAAEAMTAGLGFVEVTVDDGVSSETTALLAGRMGRPLSAGVETEEAKEAEEEGGGRISVAQADGGAQQPSQARQLVRDIIQAKELSRVRQALLVSLGLLAACAAMVVAVERWVVWTLAGLVGCYSCWLFMSRSWCARPFLNGLWLGRFDAGVSDTLLLGASILAWLWMTLLTLVPAALFASANEGAHDAGASRGAGGVACLVMALWALGWGFLWSHWRPVYTGSFDVEEFVCEGFRDKGIQPIGEQQRLAHMPPDWLLRLKFVSVVGECYNYCGFSFFPALPWRAMQTPPSVPHPQAIMLAGFLDFGDFDTRF